MSLQSAQCQHIAALQLKLRQCTEYSAGRSTVWTKCMKRWVLDGVHRN